MVSKLGPEVRCVEKGPQVRFKSMLIINSMHDGYEGHIRMMKGNNPWNKIDSSDEAECDVKGDRCRPHRANIDPLL